MSDIPKTPLWAEAADLAACLSAQGTRPLKLVAEAVQPGLAESLWPGGLWSFAAAAGRVADRQLLPYPADGFQFAVASAQSKQDYHKHEGVFEIYASAAAIEILYDEGDGRTRTARVTSGCMIVPPGLPHRVTLSGLTFIFQAALAGGQVHSDKVILPEPQPLP